MVKVLRYVGQSTDDSLLRKDKGEEMKPRTRPSRADGSAVNIPGFNIV